MEKGTQTSDEESSSEAAPKTKPAPKGARPKSAARPEEAPNLEPVQGDETTWATVVKKKPLPVGPLAKEAKGKGKGKAK